MSTPDAEGSPAAAGADGKKGRGKRKLLLLVAVPLLAVGAAGGWAFASGSLPFPGASGASAPDQPKLVPADDAQAGGPRYKTSYAALSGPFTSNLHNSSRFVQVELGVATRYDERVLQAVAEHELPLRSAVLMVLARQTEERVTTDPGRARLQEELRAAINRVLEEQTGFGGIDRVYFSGLIVQ